MYMTWPWARPSDGAAPEVLVFGPVLRRCRNAERKGPACYNVAIA